jgi:hypothetical protein
MKLPRCVHISLPRFTSAELFFSCCDSGSALSALAKFNGHVAKDKIAAAPTHSLHGAHSSRGLSGENTSFSRSGYSRARHRHFYIPY